MIEEVISAYKKLQSLDSSNELLRYISVKDGGIELDPEKKFEFTGKFCPEAEDPKKINEFETWDEFCQFVQSTLYRNYLSALEKAIIRSLEVTLRN